MQTVLLVDDEPDILESLRPLLQGAIEGLRVHTALTAKEGLEVLRRDKVDLILSDYRMPGMNGLEFLDEARGLAPGVPRILITAFPDLDIAIRAINEAGVESFITKPFKTEELLEQVRAALFKRRVEGLWRESLAQALGKVAGRQAEP